MSFGDAPSGEQDDDLLPTYSQRPRPVGFNLDYKLDGDVLVIDSTRKIDRVPLASVEQVRFTFKPGNIASTGYLMTMRLKDGKTISIGDTSWRSMVEIERGGDRYVRFVRALSAAVARANPDASFRAGKSMVMWLLFASVALLTLAMMLFFIWRAYQEGVMGAVWIGLGLGGVALWQMVPMIRLNRPIELGTGEVPSHLLPVT